MSAATAKALSLRDIAVTNGDPLGPEKALFQLCRLRAVLQEFGDVTTSVNNCNNVVDCLDSLYRCCVSCCDPFEGATCTFMKGATCTCCVSCCDPLRGCIVGSTTCLNLVSCKDPAPEAQAF